MAKALPLETLPVFGTQNQPATEFDFNQGAVLLVDKPQTWTSFDAVKYLRGRVRTKKVGHAGTLDPMATGLLIVCTGKATKSISQLQDMRKEYIGEITFGASTPSYDADSAPDKTAPFEHITRDSVQQILDTRFSGDVMQVPPMYSALKRNGQKLYELARRGKEIELEPRPITIFEIEMLYFQLPKVTLKIVCSKGTYIRSIAHDLGLALKSRGHLSGLERTAIGDFRNEYALTPHQYSDLLKSDG